MAGKEKKTWEDAINTGPSEEGNRYICFLTVTKTQFRRECQELRQRRFLLLEEREATGGTTAQSGHTSQKAHPLTQRQPGGR